MWFYKWRQLKKGSKTLQVLYLHKPPNEYSSNMTVASLQFSSRNRRNYLSRKKTNHVNLKFRVKPWLALCFWVRTHDMMQKAETSVCAQSHTHRMQIYKELSSALFQFGSFVQCHSCRGSLFKSWIWRTDGCSRVTTLEREKKQEVCGQKPGGAGCSSWMEPGATVLTQQVGGRVTGLHDIIQSLCFSPISLLNKRTELLPKPSHTHRHVRRILQK